MTIQLETKPQEATRRSMDASISQEHALAVPQAGPPVSSLPEYAREKVTEDLATEPHNDSSANEDSLGTYQLRIAAGLLLPAVIQGLNATMIAGALPFIATDFGRFSESNWITTSFSLTSATFIPIWGQLANIFGRYYSLQLASIVQLLGCALCAGAPTTSFPTLLLGRSLQGVASAGYAILTTAILADKVSLKSNAKMNSLFGFVHGIGYSVGPVAGGYLTEISWRWCFIVILPLTIIGMLIIHIFCRKILLGPQQSLKQTPTSKSARLLGQFSTIDVVGQLLFLLSVGNVILALTWGGATYSWSDVKVLCPLVIGAALFVVFVAWEYLMMPGKYLSAKLPNQTPMISLRLLCRRNIGLLMYVNFMTGMAMFAVYYFVAIYFAVVKDFPAGTAGRSLLFYIPGLGGTYIAVFACNFWPRSTWHPLAIGTLIEAIGITVIAYALKGGSLATIWGIIALAGAGTGARLMPGTLHAVGYFRDQIASVVSLMNLGGSLGNIVGSTVMFNILNNRINLHLSNSDAANTLLTSIQKFPPGAQDTIRQQIQDAIVLAFYAISAFMWFGFVPLLFLGNVKIRASDKSTGNSEDNLCQGSFVASLFLRHRKIADKPREEEINRKSP